MVRKRLPPELKKPFPSGKYNGTPIKWTDDLIRAETEALIEWTQSDCPHKLLDFCNKREILVDELYYFADISSDFARALKIAKQTIAANREDMVNKEQINYGAYNRYAALYDPLLSKFERAEKTFDAELKRQIVAGASGNVTVNITDYGK